MASVGERKEEKALLNREAINTLDHVSPGLKSNSGTNKSDSSDPYKTSLLSHTCFRHSPKIQICKSYEVKTYTFYTSAVL